MTTALARDDVTRHKDAPLVLVSDRYRLLAIAIGPPEPPQQLAVMANVARLGPHGAVEILGDDGQPSWLLFEIEKILDEIK